MLLGRFRPVWLLVVGSGTMVTGSAALLQGGGLGGPLPGLTVDERSRFDVGRNEFLHNETPQSGLGPVFNGTACAQCHRAGAPGGASADLTVSRVTRIGAMVNGEYSDLTNVGGPLLQARSLREFIQGYPLPGEVIPPQAQFVSRRITTPLFGAGLIEAIPETAIQAQAQAPHADGVHGVPNMVLNPETGVLEIGRFGWKAQVSNLHVFAGDAYLNEMGITNPSFPVENNPQGQPIPPGADPVPDPEDEGADVQAITDFMRMSAPPARRLLLSNAGENLFGKMRCTSCHLPTYQTGFSPVAALSFKSVGLYSDLLVHDMGSGLADGVRQGSALGNQWRTAPLWGLSLRPFLLHDGRATTIDQAIRLHGGEAAPSRDRYIALGPTERDALLQFLANL